MLKQRLTTFLPDEKKRKRFMIICILSVCLLLCGFSWTWFLEFTMSVVFPFHEAVHTDLILNFGSIVNVDDLQIYLTEPRIAEQLVDGIQANISGNIYSNIEIPDMRIEHPGRRIIRIIFDRLFA